MKEAMLPCEVEKKEAAKDNKKCNGLIESILFCCLPLVYHIQQ